MKTKLFYFTLSLILIACGSSRKVLYQNKEYWGEHHAGNTQTLQLEYKAVLAGSDTISYLTNYYQNGALKSKVIMKNELLLEIEMVLDTVGNKMNYGNLKNGNGYVIQFSKDDASPEREGLYVDGNREGWWKNYHYTGYISDSTFYKNGYAQFPPSENTLEDLLDLFGPIKNNLYQ